MTFARLLSAAAPALLLFAQGCQRPTATGVAKPAPTFTAVTQATRGTSFSATGPRTGGTSPSSPASDDGLPGDDSVPGLEPRGDRSAHAVLLVHGLAMDGTGMMAIQAYLASQGVPNVHTIDLPSRGLSSTMAECARTIEAFVAELARQGVTKVDLVGHSMGGLAIREYVRARRDRSVAVPTLITVATPNHGNGSVASLLEKIGMKSTISEMASNSDFIARINASPLPAGTTGYGLRTPKDDVVRPSEACILPGAQNFSVDVGGLFAHVAMAAHPASLELIHRLLTGGGSRRGAA